MGLELKNVSYYYKTNSQKTILNNISYVFETETMYAILGSSGTGKTTLLSLLAGLDVPVKGEIHYQGKDIQIKGLNYHRRKNISLVFQNYNLIDYLTPMENVMLGGPENPERLLESVGIPKEDWNRKVLQLSGGQQQRVAIARALASSAEILLADEPTGNLDEEVAEGIIDLLKESARKLRKCVIVVTHSRNVAEAADIVLKIKDGQLESC